MNREPIEAVILRVVKKNDDGTEVELAPGGTTITVRPGDTDRPPCEGDVLRILPPQVLGIVRGKP